MDKEKNKLYDSNGELVVCECGGHFIFAQRALLTEPPQFPFICDKCGKCLIQRHDKTIYDINK